MTVLKLERSSISMEEGKVVRWLVGDGALVEAGQPVAEVETDKATMDVEAPASGVLRIVAGEGETVSVDAPLAEIVESGAAPAGHDSPPREGNAGANTGADAGAIVASARAKNVASPAARRLAQERGIRLEGLAGSGPGGRIVAADVERAAVAQPVRAVAGLRELVVESIAASWREIPHIHVGGELAADGIVEARRALAAQGERATVTDLLVVAVSRAALDVPGLNGTVGSDGAPAFAARVNLALAVATDQGVVAPVLKDAARLSLAEAGAERGRLVEAARGGTLDKRDLAGATLTLSNLGAYPVDFFAPVISGPQIALVATGRLAERPVAVDGMLTVRPRVWVNVAIDHRGADGEAGGRFLAALERRFAGLARELGLSTTSEEPMR